MKEKILKNLESGNYRIEYRESCNCQFNWQLQNGKLDCEVENIDCCNYNVLVMPDLAGQSYVHKDGVLATYDALGGLDVRLRGQATLANFEAAENEITAAIYNSDVLTEISRGIESPAACNNLHHKRMQASLANWIEDNRYQVYVRYPREFSNEYECMLVVIPEEYQYDTLHVPTDWDAKSPHEWAEMYLPAHDIEVITDLYVITLSYYHKDGSTESYGGPDDWYISEADARYALNDKADPDKGDCYELCKYTVDPYSGSIDDISHLKTKKGWKE